MPKKIEPEIESEEEEEFEEDEEDEEEEEDELEVEQPTKKKGIKIGRPAKMPAKKRVKEEPEEPKKRYTVFANPKRIGIMDAETDEVVSEYGEDFSDEDRRLITTLQGQAEDKERLERIENSIGSMLEG